MSRRINRRTRKIAALTGGLLVVGIGATYTLASWNDSEWVWGGASGGPGIGTSGFEVEQNTVASGAAVWVDEESNPGGALTFTPGALALSPGDSVYAPVSLRTKGGSLGGDVTLQGAVAASGVTPIAGKPLDGPTTGAGGTPGPLWAAARVSVYTSTASTAPSCDSTSVEDEDWGPAVAGLSNAALGTAAGTAQALAAATPTVAGAPQHYCFVITLPSGAQTGTGGELMNRTIAPAWEFRAVSTS